MSIDFSIFNQSILNEFIESINNYKKHFEIKKQILNEEIDKVSTKKIDFAVLKAYEITLNH